MKGNEPLKEELLFHQSSVKVLKDRTIVTAPAGRGIWKAAQGGEWASMAMGLPTQTHVNRLQLSGETLFACTNQGMFKLERESWKPMEMPMTCYQYRDVGHSAFAATSHGLWCLTEKGWKSAAFSYSPVYDFLYTPHYLFLAMEWGIAMYDRLTCAWQEYPLGTRITGLGVFGGRLFGVTEHGEWMLGNKKGGFDKIKFPGIFIFNTVMCDRSVYVCADRGLYRMDILRGQPSLLSVNLGGPVTDLHIRDGSLYLATLSEGIQTIDMR